MRFVQRCHHNDSNLPWRYHCRSNESFHVACWHAGYGNLSNADGPWKWCSEIHETSLNVVFLKGRNIALQPLQQFRKLLSVAGTNILNASLFFVENVWLVMGRNIVTNFQFVKSGQKMIVLTMKIENIQWTSDFHAAGSTKLHSRFMLLQMRMRMDWIKTRLLYTTCSFHGN